MADVNIVVLAGRLTRDPEMRYTPSGMAVAKLGMAIGRRFKDNQTGQFREETTFVDVDVWGRQAETASQYLSKGRGLLVEGELRLDQWDDKQTGQKRSKLKVVGYRIQFLGGPAGSGGPGGPGGGGGEGGAPRPPRQAPAGKGRGPAPAQAPSSGEEPPPDSEPPPDLDIKEDDIPF
ncbi:MAG: single-stranded DNA-binding protein [Planctomycetes bacterium]|nr:single-stranded DNA-binding protein [Planctomycetota bacterium]